MVSKEAEKPAQAILSTTAKAKQRAKRTEKEKKVKEAAERGEDAMMVDIESTPGPTTEAEDKKEAEKEEKKDGEAEKKKKVEKEKVGYELQNLSRVVPAQLPHIGFLPDGRYEPVKKVGPHVFKICIQPLISMQATGGVLMLVDRKKGEPVELLEIKSRKTVTQVAAGGPAPQQPAPEVGAGAVAAVDILNMEDDEGEDAPVPDPFEYETDSEE